MINNTSLLDFSLRAAFVGGLVAGSADLISAFITYGFVGATPARILYSIASGWLGRAAALEGGVAVALLGLVSHYFILCVAAGIYGVAAIRIPALTRRPVICGAAFGLCIFAVMNYVVVPLSAAEMAGPSGVFLLIGLLVHMFAVGVPIALVVRYFSRRKAGNAEAPARQRQGVAAPPT